MQSGKITIHKLFGKYDLQVDLTKACTILIGPNGAGKSTALRLVDKLYAGDFLSVSRHSFESIEVDGCVMLHSEFLLSDAVLARCFAQLTDDLQARTRFDALVDKLREKQLLGEFLYELRQKGDLPEMVCDIVEDYFPAAFVQQLQIPLQKDEYILCYEDAPVLQSEFAKSLPRGGKIDAFYFDLTQKTTFPKRDCAVCGIFDTVQAPAAYTPDGNLTPIYRGDEGFEVLQNAVEALKQSRLEYRFAGESLTLDPTDEDTADTVCDYFRDGLYTLFKHGNFDIGGYLNMVYYHPMHIKYINLAATEAALSYVKNQKEGSLNCSVKQLLQQFGDGLSVFHEHFVRPALFKGSLFDTNLNRLAEKVRTFGGDCAEALVLQAYMEFFVKVQPNLFSDRGVCPYVIDFKNMVSSYINDKTVLMSPKGISVLLEQPRESSSLPFLMTNTENPAGIEIGMNKLSSGESKMILLCFLAQFFDDTVLLLDEPELSISILWQQRLIGDLLKDGTFTSIVVSTHSPYIAGGEELKPFIKYLP